MTTQKENILDKATRLVNELQSLESAAIGGGSERQNVFATKIRNDFFRKFSDLHFYSTIVKHSPDSVDDGFMQRLEKTMSVIAFADSQPASWWIDNRDAIAERANDRTS